MPKKPKKVKAKTAPDVSKADEKDQREAAKRYEELMVEKRGAVDAS